MARSECRATARSPDYIVLDLINFFAMIEIRAEHRLKKKINL